MALMSWVQYHDALSSFSLLQWRRYAPVEYAYLKDVGEQVVRLRSSTCCFRLKVSIFQITASGQEQDFLTPPDAR